MKRFIQLLICFLAIATTTFAGGGKGLASKFFFQLGGTIGADVLKVDGVFLKKAIDNSEPISFTTTNVNYATLMGVGRVNFLEISNNSSLSLALRPSVSFGRAYGDGGGGTSTMFRFPITLDINSGAAATVSTRAKTGFSLGLGAEFVKYPLGNAVDVVAEPNTNEGGTTGRYLNMKASWWQPVAVVGVKFFGKHYLCRELNFKFAYCSTGEIDNQTNTDKSRYGTISDWQTFGATISFLQYLNY